MIAGQKSNNCLEGCRLPATDTVITLQNINSYRLEGAEMVSKKEYIPWNKGKQNPYIFGEKNPAKRPEVRRKISEAKKGNVPWITGKHHTEETRQKISKIVRQIMVAPDVKRRLSESHKGKHNSPNTEFKKGQHSPTEFKSLEKHPLWKGGISFKPYCFKFNKNLREKIRSRDNYTCQLCGVKQNGIKLTVHHVHYDKTNCNPDLITLCCVCNSTVNFNRDYWESLFISKLKERGLLI